MLQSLQLKRIKQKLPKQFLVIAAVNIILIVFQLFYLDARFQYLNKEIPFWYTQPWGEAQLSPAENIWMIPLISFGVVLIGSISSIYAKAKFMRYGGEAILGMTLVNNFILTYSLIRIIRISSVPFLPLVNPIFLELAFPFMLAALFVYALTPKFISIAQERGIITIPTHAHPGMILQEPSARGGGILVAITFIVLTILFVPTSKSIWGILGAIVILAITGLADDIQNTNPFSKLKFMENPALRLLLQAIAGIIVIVGGIKIGFINNPFNGLIYFDQTLVNIGNMQIAPYAILITFIWIVWIINMLSWSNGVDGQYSGIVSITAIVIAILALRNINVDPGQIYVSKMAVILAGASVGLLPFNWNPSKIMWGFTATVAGLIIAALSLMTQAKVSVSIMALLIPFLDAIVTVMRRIMQKRSPLKGDRGHLHHLLLERGWSVKSIAAFYWISAGILGAVAVLASDKALPLLVLTFAGVIALPIIALNALKLKKN